jgi:molybdopterin-containing oxidoreductase family iron-sulfur binding subunit
MGGLTLAPGVTLISPAQARPKGEPASSKVRWGMLVDASKCDDGCTACVDACATENGWQGEGNPATDAQWIRKVKVTDPSNGSSQTLPMMCQHCENPACVDVCPTGASMKRADGIVLVDKHSCIGCRYCMMACPYQARSFVHEAVTGQRTHAPRGKGTVESCTFCVHRVDEGREPACVEACGGAKRGALTFGDLNDPNSEISKKVASYPTQAIRSDLGMKPGVRYMGLDT